MCLFKEGPRRALGGPCAQIMLLAAARSTFRGGAKGTPRSPKTKQETSRMIQGGPKEGSGRAMCSNSAPGCSQEYFSRRSEKLQGGSKEAPGRLHGRKSAPGCSLEHFSLRSEKLRGGSKEAPRRLQGGSKEAPGIELYKSGARLASS